MGGHVLAVASLKGGCGKSTLAWNLAAGLTEREGHGRVGLLDADPQGALTHWAAWARGSGSGAARAPEVMPAHLEPAQTLAQVRERFAWLLVDCPPSVDMSITRRVLALADTVVVPVLPSPLDLWASAQTMHAVLDAQVNNPTLAAWLLLNQVEPSSALSRAMRRALAEQAFPTLTSVVRRRAAFRSAALEGVSVYQLGARGRQAARDIDQVIEELLRP